MELLLNFLSMADVSRASLPYLATPALMFARLGRAIFQTECTPNNQRTLLADATHWTQPESQPRTVHGRREVWHAGCTHYLGQHMTSGLPVSTSVIRRLF